MLIAAKNMYSQSLLVWHTYKETFVMNHGVLKFFFNSPTILYTSLICLLHVPYIQWPSAIGLGYGVMGYGVMRYKAWDRGVVVGFKGKGSCCRGQMSLVGS